MRINNLLQKIKSLAESPEPRSIIDVDLMLDYTRVLYADLLEWRSQLAPKNFRPEATKEEPTLDELTEMMAAKEQEDAIALSPLNIAADKLSDTKAIKEVGAEAKFAADPKVSPPDPPVAAPPVATSSGTETAKSQPPMPESIPVLAAATQKVIPSADIRSVISINDKYQFMSVLFGNDKAAYEAALDRVNEFSNAMDAENWLQERLWIAEEQQNTVLEFFDLIRNFKKN